MIRVRTASRLHFGLLSLPSAGDERWPNLHGEAVLPARRFGGVGLMVEAPGVEVAVAPAPAWSAEGPLAERALIFARRFAQTLPPHRLVVEQCAPGHSGLGTGTQLALAVARALAVEAGRPDMDAAELARRVGRGLRSALGIHGFARGGFLVESGKRTDQAIAPLTARVEFPEEWRVVLVLPSEGEGQHGTEEQRVFDLLAERDQALAHADALCRLVLLGMLPALRERDLEAFGEALYDFNARVGEAFAPVQGGTYASAFIGELVAFVRQQGVRGTGQSSWGPTVFAITADAQQARTLADRVRSRFGLAAEQVIVTGAANRGAEVLRENC
jgi:beta-RFAP synthase